MALSKIYQKTKNVSNIRYSDKNKWIGQCGSYKGFACFLDQIYSIRALILLLKRYISLGYDTVETIISRFAPESKNDTKAYISFVREYMEKYGRFSNEIQVSSVDFRLLVQAICCFETGYILSSYEFCYVCTRFGL